MNMKVETVGMLEWGQANQRHQMDGMGSVMWIVKNGAGKDGMEGQEACVESLAMSFDGHWILRALWENLRLSIWKCPCAFTKSMYTHAKISG